MYVCIYVCMYIYIYVYVYYIYYKYCVLLTCNFVFNLDFVLN